MEIAIPRDVAIFLLHHRLVDERRGMVACKEYTPEDDDFVEIMPEEWETILEDEGYQTFVLWVR